VPCAVCNAIPGDELAYTCNILAGFVVPIPTLPLLLTVIGVLEFPMVELVPLPVKTGTVPEVPLPVTVCAAPPADANAKTSHARFARFVMISIPSLPAVGLFYASGVALNSPLSEACRR
jgi:hypothetical protein